MDDGHGTLRSEQLRLLVREVLAEVVARVPPAARSAASRASAGASADRATAPPAPPSSVPAADAVTGPGRKVGGAGQHGTSHDDVGNGGSGDAAWTVRISTDDDLHAFALRVLKLADNPKLRRDLIGGRIRFTLSGQAAGAQAAAHRVDKGAVTERTVAAAAKAGARLVLGPRAVLTPLAKDKARALGVPIQKEER
jgi:hypothetical protein